MSHIMLFNMRLLRFNVRILRCNMRILTASSRRMLKSLPKRSASSLGSTQSLGIERLYAAVSRRAEAPRAERARRSGLARRFGGIAR